METRKMSDEDAEKEVRLLIKQIQLLQHENFYNFPTNGGHIMHIVFKEKKCSLSYTPSITTQFDVLEYVLMDLTKNDDAKTIDFKEMITCQELFQCIKLKKHEAKYIISSPRGSPLFIIYFTKETFSIIGEPSPYMKVLMLRKVWDIVRLMGPN